MIDNELQVRLLHAAKDRTGWKQASSTPKLGEVCLESSVDPNNSLGLVFKIKIGDNHRKFCRYIGSSEVIPPPLTPESDWDFTSDEVLPYFGTVVTTSGTPQVCTFYTYTSGDLNGTTVIRIYDLALSSVTASGETTITLNTSNYREIRPGSNIAFNATSDSILTIAASMDFSTLDTDSDIALAEWHEADPQVSGDTNAIRIYEIKEVNGVISKGTNFIAIKVSSPLEISNTNGVITISIQDATTSQKGAVQLLDTYTTGDGGNVEDNTKATTNKAITAALGTITAGNKINIGRPTTGTDAGKIIINHDTVASPTVTQGTQDIPSSYNEGEKETLVITDVATDGYGHITGYKSEASTNLIAADIKAPVSKQDNSTWNYRETGGDITIGEDTARISSLKGNTVVWNQLVGASTSSVTLVSQHKYYTVIDGTKSIQTGTDSAIPVTGGTDMVVDLTKMFGETIANSMTAENFEKLFPASYYPYCEGRLVNLGGYGVKWNQLVDSSTSSVTLTSGHIFYTKISGSSSLITGTGQSQATTGGNDIVVDLTLMFGPGSEPTLEEFEAMFPDDYYEYDAGTEMNIFDIAAGENKLGLISTSNNIPDEGDPHAVDMGLPSGLLWADSNIDITQEDGFAASPYQYGCTMFSWGNVEGHNTPATGTTFDYNWGDANSQEPWYDGQVYGNTPGNSLTADIVTHDASQDAAYRNVGAPWRMPSSAEFQELFDNCIYIDADGVEVASDKTDKRVTVNGILGLYLQSKANGNRLFFSASGLGGRSSWYSLGSGGYYWSRSFLSARDARYLSFYSGGVNPQNNRYRFNGFAVRPVRYKKQTLDLDWIREIEYTPDGSSTPEKLFPYGLLSVDSVHDEVTETKAVKRIERQVLNTSVSGWNYWFDNLWYYNNVLSQNAAPNTKIISDRTTQFFESAGGKYIYFDATGMTNPTAENINNIANGATVNYVLATPIEVDIYPAKNMSYIVDDHGTEQQMPVNASSVINAPFVGTFEYYSNFKDAIRDAIRDLFNKVNNQKNPVKGVDDTPQTNGKLAVYDSDHTVKSSDYSVLPLDGNPFEGSDTNILLPTAEQIINYVNEQIASSLTYKGVVSGLTGSTSGKIYFSDITNPTSGDLYFLGNLDGTATSMIVDSTASSTYAIAEGTYYPGTMFIWNASTVGFEYWDAIAGTTIVSDNNPTLWIDQVTPDSSGHKQYTVGSIEGHYLHVTVPTIAEIAGQKAAGQVLVGNGTGQNDDIASWRGLKLDETVNNNNTSIGDLTTGLLERYDNGSLDTHSYQWRLADPSAVNLINPTNSSATAGKVLVGNYNSSSATHTTPPSWRNLKLDELSYDGTNLIPNLGTGLLKRKGNNDWELTEESLVWKTTSGTTNFDAVSSDGTSLTNKIHNYTNVTTIELGSHLDGSTSVVDGFRINIPLLTSTDATVGKVLKGTKTTGVTTLPTWDSLSIEELSEISSATATEGTHGYLKRVDNGASATTRYTWEFDPYGGGGVMPYKSNSSGTGDVATSSKTTAEINNLSTTGEKILARTALREQVGTGSYVYHKISVGALENDSNIVLVLNGNFS